MNQYPTYQNQESVILLPVKPPKVRLHTGIIAFAVTLGMLLALVVQVIIQGVITTYYPAIAENDWYMWTFSTVPLYLVGMPVAYLLFLTVPKSVPQKKKMSPLMWIGFLFLCFLLTYITNFIGQFVNDLIYDLLGIEVQNDLAEMTYITPFGINLLFVGILAPIFEELFYRKAVIDRLRRYGDLPAILISGLIFGLVHGNFSQVFYATAIGMLLGFIYLRTGNILYTITLHTAFNIIGGVYTTEMVRRMGDTLTPAEGDLIGTVMLLAYSVFTILAVVVGFIFLIVNLKRFCRTLQKGQYSLTFDQWMNALVFNPGMWAFLAWTAIVFVSSLLASAF